MNFSEKLYKERGRELVSCIVVEFVMYCDAECCAFICVVTEHYHICQCCIFVTVATTVSVWGPTPHPDASARCTACSSQPVTECWNKYDVECSTQCLPNGIHVWDFDCGTFLWVVTNILSKSRAFIFEVVISHESGGGTFLQNVNHHLPVCADHSLNYGSV
jgi:hypothetical protein